MLNLGYHGLNHTLREQHILTDRTARMDTVKREGIILLRQLYVKNLYDLFAILKWNVEHKIYFYRISSGIAPHITNPEFLSTADKKNYRKLVYALDHPLLKKIGDYAKEHGMRLTFHPGIHTTINPLDPQILLRSMRDLYYHTLIMDLMGLDDDGVIVLHGGSTYSNVATEKGGGKGAAMKRWITNYNKMPSSLKRRIVLENDEQSYSIEDVLQISSFCHPPVPIVFDYFHYQCYNKTIERYRANGYTVANQKPIAELLPKIVKTWGRRRVKMHLSEQKSNAPLGSHTDYVHKIPLWMKQFPKKFKRDLDLMIEVKLNEKAVLKLRGEN